MMHKLLKYMRKSGDDSGGSKEDVQKIIDNVEAKRWTRYEIFVLVLIMFGWAFDGAEIYIFGSTADFIAHSLLYAATLTAVILIGFNGGQLISTVLISWLADVRGRRIAFMVSIAIYSIASLLTGLSWNFASLLFFRVLVGIGTGVEWGLGATIAAEVLPARRRGTAISIFNGGFPIGGFIASLVFLLIVVPAPYTNWRYAYFVFAVPAVLLLFMRQKYFKETERFQLSKEVVKKKSLKNSYSELFVNTKMRKNTLLGTLISAPMRWNTLPWLALVELTLIATRGFTASLVAEYILINTVFAMVGYFTGGTIADYIGRRPAWYIYFSLVVVGYLLSILAINRNFIMLGGALWGFGWGFSPIEVLMLSELFPTRARASGEGFALGIGLAGAIVIAYLWLGWVHLYGYTNAAVLLMLPLIIPPIALALGFRTDTKGKVLENISYIESEEAAILR
jgi:putative MFS transporter